MLNRTVATRYAVATIAAAVAGVWLRPWGWLLIWLAVSLAAQALAYAGWGAQVFRKTNGRLPWSVRIVLAPYMICARITLHYYCRGFAPYAVVAPGVWIGRRLTDAEARDAIEKGVTATLDLTAGFPECAPLLAVRYCNIQLLPITVPSFEQLREAVRFIQDESRRGIVYVHGALGYSRSVGTVAAYLLASGLALNVRHAIDQVQAVTPQALLQDEWMKRLNELAGGLVRIAEKRA